MDKTSVAFALLLAIIAMPQAPVAEDVIVWSETRRLTWNDFKAKPPSGQLVGARSAIGFGYSFGCRDGQLHARVVARFHPTQSWVGYRIISSGLASRVGLHHEQKHFDLSEVYARRIRKYFRELNDPCPRSDAELEQLADRIFQDETAAQRRYDKETENGQHGGRQEKWDKEVAQQLVDLAAFADSGKVFSLVSLLVGAGRPAASSTPSRAPALERPAIR